MNWNWLFEWMPFVTRDHCGIWPSWMSMTYQIANLATFTAYCILFPEQLWHLYASRNKYSISNTIKLKYQFVVIGFLIFIFVCGVTHAFNILVFYYAPYRLDTLIQVITGIVSLWVALGSRKFIQEVAEMVPLEVKNEAFQKLKASQVHNAKLIEEKEIARRLAEEKSSELMRHIEILEGMAWEDKAMDRLEKIQKIKEVILDVKDG